MERGGVFLFLAALQPRAAINLSFGIRPTLRLFSTPSRRHTTVGMLITPKRSARACSSSIFTLHTFTSGLSFASSSKQVPASGTEVAPRCPKIYNNGASHLGFLFKVCSRQFNRHISFSLLYGSAQQIGQGVQKCALFAGVYGPVSCRALARNPLPGRAHARTRPCFLPCGSGRRLHSGTVFHRPGERAQGRPLPALPAFLLFWKAHQRGVFCCASGCSNRRLLKNIRLLSGVRGLCPFFGKHRLCRTAEGGRGYVHLLCRRRLRKKPVLLPPRPVPARGRGNSFIWPPASANRVPHLQALLQCSSVARCRSLAAVTIFSSTAASCAFSTFYTGGNIICRACHHIAHLRFFRCGRAPQSIPPVRSPAPSAPKLSRLRPAKAARHPFWPFPKSSAPVRWLSEPIQPHESAQIPFLPWRACFPGRHGRAAGQAISHLLQLGCHAIVGSQQFIPLFFEEPSGFSVSSSFACSV